MRTFVAGILLLIAAIAGCGDAGRPEPLRVAVASNFAATLDTLAAAWRASGGGPLEAVPGATGVLATQIRNGAPFDVFLAADARRPDLLAAEGTAVDSAFVYALGTLVLWTPAAAAAGHGALTDLGRLAVANPEVAPYGIAAMQTLAGLGLLEELAPRLVRGANVAQAFQFAATGNADAAMVAASQVLSQSGGRWEVPADLHEPIVQKAVLVRDGASARAFLAFLRGPAAREIIRRHGYRLPATGEPAP